MRHNADFRYNMWASTPGVTDLIDRPITSDPLNITEGNDDLRNTYRHSLQVHHGKNYKKNQMMLRGGFDFILTQNATAMSQLYDPKTGI